VRFHFRTATFTGLLLVPLRGLLLLHSHSVCIVYLFLVLLCVRIK